MYDTVLVPTDGSDHAVRAAEHAAYLARTFDAAVHVITVVDVQRAAGMFDAGGVDERFVENLETEGQKAIEAIEAAIGDLGAVETAVVRGSPKEAILEYADEHGADVLAMGTHGRTGIDRYVLGSVTENVVRQASVPVLTTRATGRSAVTGYDDILVPTDGSEAALAAVDHGVAIARQTGARVHAVSVFNRREFSPRPGAPLPAEVEERLEAEAERATETVAERAREAGLDAVSAVSEGAAASVLLEYADDHDIDLTVMATAGRTGPSRYLLGSTTERVIRHAETPVLAVNARDLPEGR